MIYLDYAATTPMSEKSVMVYGEVAGKYFGNASSIHDYGSSAQKIIEGARDKIAHLINAEARGIFFTGGGSEANQLTIQSIALANKKRGKHIITTGAEHSSVRNTLKSLEAEGFEVTYTPIGPTGKIILEELEKNIREDTILASIHHGNSEIGTIQDIEAIGSVLKSRDVLFHSDCVQTFGKIPVDTQAAHIDAVSISAHKIYGPKGVGAAYINPSVNWKPVIPGTTQEKGFRHGTVDVPGVAAFMVAAGDIAEQMDEEIERERKLREHLVGQLRELPFEISLEGDSRASLPNIVGLRIHGMEGQYAMLECNRHGLAISTGSACSVGTEKASASMVALGRSEQEAREFIRLSLGKQTSREEIDDAVSILKKVLTEHFNMVKL